VIDACSILGLIILIFIRIRLMEDGVASRVVSNVLGAFFCWDLCLAAGQCFRCFLTFSWDTCLAAVSMF